MRSMRTPALVATVVVVPLLVLELVSAAGDRQSRGPDYWPGVFLLHLAMWSLAFGFVVVWGMVIRDMTTGGYVTAHPAKTAVRVGLLVLLAASFAFIAIDQMTCFTGLPHCD